MPERFVRTSVTRFAVASLWSLLALASCTPIEPVLGTSDAGQKRSAVESAADAGQTATGKAPSCKRDSDCPRSSACTRARCEAGKCGEQPEEDGTPLPASEQVPGDCRTLLCDGAGKTRTVPNDADTQQGESNPCQLTTCNDGEARVVDAAPGSACNGNGTCTNGMCSVCTAGGECSKPGDCTVHRWVCDQGKAVCTDSGETRATGTCQDGKICQDGRCVPCTVGAECEVSQACMIGIITSCNQRVQCEPRPISGPACDPNDGGQRRYCVNGVCTLPCREGQCMAASDPCHSSRWDCSNGDAAPSCVALTNPDGTPCGDASTCHAGKCSHSVLLNGNFARGLDGWTAAGDAGSFMLAARAGRVQHSVLSTSSDGKNSGGGLHGSLSQIFSVPDDALALRFAVWGGRGHVRLKDAAGGVLEDCTGVSSDSEQVPVSWDLSARRGQQLTLAIEDDLTSGDWAYVTLSGFDVIRDVDAPLRNPQFLQDWTGWEASGDAARFNLFLDYNHYRTLENDPAYGTRRSVSTYSRDQNGPYGSPAMGTVSQQFVVPPDAVALRFNVHGGSSGRVYLAAGSETLHTVSAEDADMPKLPVDWPLDKDRNRAVRLVIEDMSSAEPYGYIGTSGFDLITSYNGP